jgi:spore coat polysaccharide biosynthesis protein SpsF
VRVAATIEARMASTRLPGKVLLPLAGKPALHMMIERIKHSGYVDDIIIATTTNKEDAQIENLALKLGVKCYRGSEEDVLSRVLEASKTYKVDLICELTGDCPLIDPVIIDQVITAHLSGNYDYTSNTFTHRTFPRGLDVHVFPVSVLERTAELTSDPIDRVHVSYFIYTNPKLFKLNGVYANPEVFGPDIRITLDTFEDYEIIGSIYSALYKPGEVFLAKDIIKYLKDNPDIAEKNRSVRQKAVHEG